MSQKGKSRYAIAQDGYGVIELRGHERVRARVCEIASFKHKISHLNSEALQSVEAGVYPMRVASKSRLDDPYGSKGCPAHCPPLPKQSIMMEASHAIARDGMSSVSLTYENGGVPCPKPDVFDEVNCSCFDPDRSFCRTSSPR